MKVLWKVLSIAGLALTVVPSLLVFAGSLPWRTHATLMLIGAAAWFATAPLWMQSSRAKRKSA